MAFKFSFCNRSTCSVQRSMISVAIKSSSKGTVLCIRLPVRISQTPYGIYGPVQQMHGPSQLNG
jgi:hypothetical protein